MSSTTFSGTSSSGSPSSSHDQSSGDGLVHQFFDTIANNGRLFLGLLVVLLVLGGIGIAFSVKNDEKANAASNALFVAEKTLGQELKGLADVKKKGATEDVVAFDPFDVDQKLPQGVKALRAIVDGEYKNTHAAYEARLVLGNLYFNHGDSAKALAEYQAAVQAAPIAHEKTLAWMSQGHAEENLSKFQDALASYTHAQSAADTDPLRAEALLAQGRVQELLKDSAKAKSAYEQVMKLMPGTEYARTAESLKARFQ